jgi:predicted dinucleotide-utilizing enzyme
MRLFSHASLHERQTLPMKTGFGIVGTGMISKFHAMAIKDIPTAKLVGCSDMKPERAAAFGKEEGCTGYESLEAMLADPAIQVVTICTPSGAHVEPAVAAAKAGKHVLVRSRSRSSAATGLSMPARRTTFSSAQFSRRGSHRPTSL